MMEVVGRSVFFQNFPRLLEEDRCAWCRTTVAIKAPYTTQSSGLVEDVDVVGAGNGRVTATVETRRLLFCSEALKTWDNILVVYAKQCGVVY